jgi:hypothetical protein
MFHDHWSKRKATRPLRGASVSPSLSVNYPDSISVSRLLRRKLDKSKFAGAWTAKLKKSVDDNCNPTLKAYTRD